MPWSIDDPFLRGILRLLVGALFTSIALLPPLVMVLLWIYLRNDIPLLDSTLGFFITVISSPIKDIYGQVAFGPVVALTSVLALLCFEPAKPPAAENTRLLNGLGKYVVIVLIAGVLATAISLLIFDSFRSTLDEFVNGAEIEQLKTSIGVLLAFQFGYLAQLFGMRTVK